MQVIEYKVQWAPIVGKDADGNERTTFVRLGIRVEFDDGHAIKCPNGQVLRGTGTVARYSFKHGTWSVQPPDRCKLTRMGYVFERGLPAWEQVKRTSGMSDGSFRVQYSTKFVGKCVECLVLGY